MYHEGFILWIIQLGFCNPYGLFRREKFVIDMPASPCMMIERKCPIQDKITVSSITCTEGIDYINRLTRYTSPYPKNKESCKDNVFNILMCTLDYLTSERLFPQKPEKG